MTLLIAGLIIFLGIHSVSIVAPAWRDAQLARRGERAWKGAYSVVSLIGFALLLYGYGAARQSSPILYAPPAAMRHVALLLMLPVFPLCCWPRICRGASRARSSTRCCWRS